MLESFFSNSTKSSIVSTLAEEFPLTAKQLFNRLIKEKGLNVTYQAVHKALNELEEKNIVLKKDLGYVLSEKWISEAKKAFMQLEQKQSNSEKYVVPENFEGTIRFHFDNYNKFCVRMAEIFLSKALVGSGTPELYGILTRPWWPFKINFMDFVLLGKMCLSNGKTHVLIRRNGSLDKFVADMYLRGGFEKALVGVEGFDFEEDIAIQGDSVTKVTFSKETEKELNKIYSENKDLSDLFAMFLSRKDPKVSIDVEITKDPIMAKIFRKQIQEKFKEAP